MSGMDARAAFYAGFTHDELVQTAAALEGALAKARDRVTALEETVRLTLEAVAFGHDVTLHSRLHRELLAVLNAGRPS